MTAFTDSCDPLTQFRLVLTERIGALAECISDTPLQAVPDIQAILQYLSDFFLPFDGIKGSIPAATPNLKEYSLLISIYSNLEMTVYDMCQVLSELSSGSDLPSVAINERFCAELITWRQELCQYARELAIDLTTADPC